MDTVQKVIILRKTKNWPQTDLAKKSGVSRVMIGKYERAEVAPSIEAAKKIADAFNVSFDYLIQDTQEIPQEIENIGLSKKIRLIEQIEDDEQNMVFKFIDSLLTKKKFKDFFQKNVAAL
jgi:transcriptional regulator with XRE-family HTH domain